MKRKKYFKAAISLGIGTIMLASAVFANYENAGGYSVCKEALKKVVFSENFSVDYVADVTVDSESLAKTCGSYKLNAKGNPSMQSETTDTSDDRIYYSKQTCQDDIKIIQTSHSEIPESEGFILSAHRKPQSIATDMAGDEKTGEKMIGFLETLSDTLIGDLKNSFVLISDEDGIKKYNVALAKEQLPAYVNSGVSLITSTVREENYLSEEDDASRFYRMFFGKGEPYIKNVSADMSVDADGNPVQISASVNVSGSDENGGEHILAVNISFDFYDFGKTEVERISDSEIAKLTDHRINATETKDVLID